MTLCKECQNMFLANVMADGKVYTTASCVKNPSLFKVCGNIEEDLGYKCTVWINEDDEVKIPIISKCNHFKAKFMYNPPKED